ncbi:MAG: sigma-54-dependent Fis family transcriptional regulator [Proteobacteria bacterium]|nr:sigma-54-dependent Fis family transcriptional regulator [Pseudomonadota bacterium]
MAEILVVDDDRGMREFLEIMLTQEGHSVRCAGDGKKALEICKKHKFDLAITDLKMPKVDGIDFLKGVKELSPETMVILITAYASGDTAVTAMKEGAYDYIEKNFDIEDLKKIVQDALEKKGGKEDDAQFIKNIKDADRFGSLIGKSKETVTEYFFGVQPADNGWSWILDHRSFLVVLLFLIGNRGHRLRIGLRVRERLRKRLGSNTSSLIF